MDIIEKYEDHIANMHVYYANRLEDLRARCAKAARSAVRHSQQTTDQCRDEVALAVLSTPFDDKA
jgi:TPP-dependent pyruvate/acetoin dehydrogenase alpha subunit